MLDFKYTEIAKAGNRDYVYFYARNPETGKLQRVRYYLNHIKTKRNRDRYAKKLMNHINYKLDTGWNPFIHDSDKKKYTKIDVALEFVLTYKLKYIRKRSIPNYKQRMRALIEWLNSKGMLENPIFDFTEGVAIDFMNDLLMKHNIKGRTYNNYLIDLRGFFNLLVKQKYLSENPFRAVAKLPETEKETRPFTVEEQDKYRAWLRKFDYNFYIISMYTYYCAVRPKEITELRIKDVNLEKGFIHVPASVSKNKKQRIIPIARIFLNDLRAYLTNYPSDYYLCGRGIKPCKEYTYPTRIAERFREIASELNLPMEVKFYSLKDTAAERLLSGGFTAKTIRDHFGHSNISITDAYIKKFNIQTDNKLVEEYPEF